MLGLLLAVPLRLILAFPVGALPCYTAWVAHIQVWALELLTWLQPDSPAYLVCLTTFFPQRRTLEGVEAIVLRSHLVLPKLSVPKDEVLRCRSNPARQGEVPRVRVPRVLLIGRTCMML